MNTSKVSFDARFGQVAGAYRHEPKLARPGPGLDLAAVYFKWYLVEPEGRPIADEERAQAQGWLREEIERGRLALNDEVGFVVQHRCTSADILYVCTWRNDNEAWETLYHRPAGQTGGFKRLAREDTSPTFCVWVIPVVAHEALAWSRYLRSPRDSAAQAAYLADQWHGEV